MAAYGNNNITGNPTFKNTGAAPFALAAGSPCINTGTNVTTWMVGKVDLLGNPRMLSSRVDMGAYEFVPPLGTMIRLQ